MVALLSSARLWSPFYTIPLSDMNWCPLVFGVFFVPNEREGWQVVVIVDTSRSLMIVEIQLAWPDAPGQICKLTIFFQDPWRRQALHFTL